MGKHILCFDLEQHIYLRFRHYLSPFDLLSYKLKTKDMKNKEKMINVFIINQMSNYKLLYVNQINSIVYPGFLLLDQLANFLKDYLMVHLK